MTLKALISMFFSRKGGGRRNYYRIESVNDNRREIFRFHDIAFGDISKPFVHNLDANLIVLNFSNIPSNASREPNMSQRKITFSVRFAFRLFLPPAWNA